MFKSMAVLFQVVIRVRLPHVFKSMAVLFQVVCVGSIEELKTLTGNDKITDLHREL